MSLSTRSFGLVLVFSALGVTGCGSDPELVDTRPADSGDVSEVGGDAAPDTSVPDTLVGDTGTIEDTSDASETLADTRPEAAAEAGPPPSVTATLPLDGRVGVGRASVVKVTFSAPMKTATLTVQATSGACSGSFQLLEGPGFTNCVGGAIASADGVTFTFTPAAELGQELRYKVKVTNVALGADDRAVTPHMMVTGFKTQRFPVDAKILYMSAGRTGSFGGAAGGDTVCTTMGARPVGVVTAKAMVTDATRVACTVSNCGTGNVQTNWVLSPNTHYVRADGAYVFLSNASGIFTAYPGANDLGSGLNFWDGINSDWTSRLPNCTDWSSTSVNGAVGFDVVLNSAWLSGGQLGCASTKSFVCAEQ